jgi:VanZ family protein
MDERREQPLVNGWIWAAVAWICVIFYSSTSLALMQCVTAFHLVMGVLFHGLHPTDGPFDILQLIADKGLHVTLFAIFGILLWKALAPVRPKPLLILGIGLCVGSASEFLQSFFPDRDPALRDVLINVCGTGIGVFISIAYTRFVTGASRLPDGAASPADYAGADAKL